MNRTYLANAESQRRNIEDLNSYSRGCFKLKPVLCLQKLMDIYYIYIYMIFLRKSLFGGPWDPLTSKTVLNWLLFYDVDTNLLELTTSYVYYQFM